MSTTTEALLADLSEKLGELTQAYVKLEVTTRTDGLAMREDIGEMREDLRNVIRTQTDISHRLTSNEVQVAALHGDQRTVADLVTRVSVLETRVDHITPQKTPWTAIMSAIVALGALAWTLFGK